MDQMHEMREDEGEGRILSSVRVSASLLKRVQGMSKGAEQGAGKASEDSTDHCSRGSVDRGTLAESDTGATGESISARLCGRNWLILRENSVEREVVLFKD